jgi:hypothetical protein
MALSWVNVVRSDGGGESYAVYVDANYVDAAGLVGKPFKTETGQHTFETLDPDQKPNWRKLQTIGRSRTNRKKTPIVVILEAVEPEAIT